MTQRILDYVLHSLDMLEASFEDEMPVVIGVEIIRLEKIAFYLAGRARRFDSGR